MVVGLGLWRERVPDLLPDSQAFLQSQLEYLNASGGAGGGGKAGEGGTESAGMLAGQPTGRVHARQHSLHPCLPPSLSPSHQYPRCLLADLQATLQTLYPLFPSPPLTPCLSSLKLA